MLRRHRGGTSCAAIQGGQYRLSEEAKATPCRPSCLHFSDRPVGRSYTSNVKHLARSTQLPFDCGWTGRLLCLAAGLGTGPHSITSQ
jgi:hypothetical protein